MKNLTLIIFAVLGFSIWSFFIGKNYTEKKAGEPIKPDTASVSVVNPIPASTSKPEIQYLDSIIYRDTGTFKIVLIPDSIYVEIPADSAGIVADYLLQRNYVFDTTMNEVHAIINASVFANKLIKMDYQLVNIRNRSPAKYNFKAGANFGINDFSPGIQIEKNKFTYQLNYDLIGTEKGLRGGIYYDF